MEMHLKPADQIGLSDIQSLIATRVPEGDQIEFKESLSTEGHSVDPWMEGKNKIGEQAKDALLREVVGFANAYGGVVLLGIGESVASPPVATRITPVRRCAALAERLKLVFRDRVEPTLPRIDIFAVRTAGDDGIVVIRVGRSRLAPHRVTRTRVCPVRRADRCEEMSMREIQDMTLNLSRGLERLETRLSRRSKRFEKEFRNLQSPNDAWGVRLTATPVGDEIRIDRVFENGSLAREFNERWHRVSHVTGATKHTLDGLDPDGCLFPHEWQPRLRATRAQLSLRPDGNDRHTYREIHCDGLIELGFLSVRTYLDQEEHRPYHLPPDLLVNMFANLATWADRVRTQAFAPTAEYALDVEIVVVGDTVSVSNSNPLLFDPYHTPMLQVGSTKFYRFSLTHSADIHNLIKLFHRDLWNVFGKDVGTDIVSFEIES